jgi:hypothetical protein
MQDARLLLSGTIGASNAITGQTLTGVTTSAWTASSYSLDMNPGKQVGVDFGEGTPLFLKWVIQTTITGASALQIGVCTDSRSDLANIGQSPNLTFSSGPAAGATSGTLSGNWAGQTGSYNLMFSTGEQRTVTLTNASTAVTWTTGLAATVGTAAVLDPFILVQQTINNLNAGQFGFIPVLPNIGRHGYEYLGACFEAVGSTVTAGAIITELTNAVDDPRRKNYASGFTVV